jgi:hypothetical protein
MIIQDLLDPIVHSLISTDNSWTPCLESVWDFFGPILCAESESYLPERMYVCSFGSMKTSFLTLLHV